MTSVFSARRRTLQAQRGANVPTVGALCLVLVCMLLSASCAAAQTPGLSVFPIPGSQVASPQTQITLRGVPVRQLGSITVTGARSGHHAGRLVADSDDGGGSFLPSKPFSAGERVTVVTQVPVIGGKGDGYQFVTARPASPSGVVSLPAAARVHGDVQHFQSRPDLDPPSIKIVKRNSDPAAGDIFLGPQNGPLQNGPMLLDSSGQLIWFKATPRNTFATDFRVQALNGSSVLTWWQGSINAGVGTGRDLIDDTSYHQIYSLRAGNGLNADLHEFQLTPQGTALITAYRPVLWDARSIHLPSQSVVFDSVIQEIDIRTGLVLFQWDSLDHVPLSDSYAAHPKSPKQAFDYFHINSIQQDTDRDLVVSARNTWAGYKIDHGTGAILWTLGGKRSSLKMGSGAQFAFQHDIRVRSPQVVTVFDDGAGDTPVHRQSRGLSLKLDFVHGTATRIGEYDHSPRLLAFFEGNLQELAGGNVFLGWGQQPYFTEFDQHGHLVFDGRFVNANSGYRAYRFPWSGVPKTNPAIATHTSGRISAVYTSWNGATNVSAWRILGGSASSAMKPLRTVTKQGFETRVAVSTQRYLAVQALDRSGRVLGQSKLSRTR